MNRIAALLAALLLCLAAPPVALAQFGPTNVPAPLTDPEEEDSAPIEEDTGLSTFQLVLIFGAVIGVIGLVAFVIVRDARSAAPAAARSRASASDPGTGPKTTKSAREREREKARKRNRAKAARNQRKRNRPR